MIGNSLLFFDLSNGEFLLIMLVAFIIIVNDQIPELVRKGGRKLNKINCTCDEITSEIMEETHSISSELKTTYAFAITRTSFALNPDKA